MKIYRLFLMMIAMSAIPVLFAQDPKDAKGMQGFAAD